MYIEKGVDNFTFVCSLTETFVIKVFDKHIVIKYDKYTLSK